MRRDGPGYKSLDPARQATSPTFREGVEDGTEDMITASQCPPGSIHGPLQPGWMYRAGYERAYSPMPCPCDGTCKDGKKRDTPLVEEPHNDRHMGTRSDRERHERAR